jgi:GTPase SAR1 family protein/WD40 repeat protein
LGHDDPGWLDRVNVYLQGVSASAEGLLRWIDPNSEALRRAQEVVSATASQLARTRGFARRDLLLALHTMTVFTAFFEAVRGVCVGPVPAVTEWYEEDALFVRNLYAEEVPVPSAARVLADTAEDVRRWAVDRGERVRRALGKGAGSKWAAGLLDSGFARDVTDRYRSGYLDLVAVVPEFALWARLDEQHATRTALARLPELLCGVQAREPVGDLRAVLGRLNRAALDQPAFDSLANGVVVPVLGEIYVSPNFRMSEATASAMVADESWWLSAVDQRHDLALLLARHFSTTEATRFPLLVLGGPGSGKSTLLKVLAARLPEADYTAVRVLLRSVDADAPIMAQVEQAMEQATDGRVRWSALCDEGADALRVLLLDGLDELLPTSTGRSAYLEEIAEMQRVEALSGHPIAVVVTSRTSVADRVRIPAGTPVVKLEEFDGEQIRQWIDIWNHANADTPRSHVTLEVVRAHEQLARNPLSLLMVVLQLIDSAAPGDGAGLSPARLFRHRIDFHVRREVLKANHTSVSPEVVGQAVAERVSALAVAALGMFNRGREWMTEAEFRADLAALGHREPDDPLGESFFIRSVQRVNGLMRGYEILHPTFTDCLIADLIVEVLTAHRGASRGELLFALLSHRVLALRPQVLVFAADSMSPVDRTHAVGALGTLIREYSQRSSTELYRDYRPTEPDLLRSPATYSANLVLLRLHLGPSPVQLPAGELVELWKFGLDAEGYRSTLSLFVVDGDKIVRRQDYASKARVASVEGHSQASLPAGIEFVHRRLSTGTQPIGQITWSSDGRLLSAISDGRLCWWSIEGAPRLTNADHGASDVAWHPSEPVAAVVQRSNGAHRVMLVGYGKGRELCRVPTGTRIAWSPDTQALAMHNVDGVQVLDIDTRARRRTGEHRAGTLSVSDAHYRVRPRWTEDGKFILVTNAGGVHMLRADNLALSWSVVVDFEVMDVFAPQDDYVRAAGVLADGNSVLVENLVTSRPLAMLEGHTKRVVCVRFSSDGRYLATAATDNTVRIWRCRDWQCVAVLPRERVHRRGGIAFHPTEPLVAVKDGGSVDVLRLNYSVLGTIGAALAARRYANAKIVLVGDTGVGKSGLGLVLSGKPYEPTTSTHGRNVWTFERSYTATPEGDVQTRETLLWDLAGQPGYRMVHQLHLNEVAVALVVFDARSETDPFAGVRYWCRALAQARRLDGDAALPLQVFLVAARADRGGVVVSPSRLQAVLESLGVDKYFETSAKEGWGVEELSRDIRDAIDWNAVPVVSSTALFESIREFVVEEKQQGRTLTTVDDLLHTFRRVRKDAVTDEDLADRFSACMGRLESVGLVRRMAFGDYVLLRPELLDAYASALVQAAKAEPDGLGFVSEADALAGRFRMSAAERLSHPQQEKVLLISVVEELLRREIALKEVTDREVDLIFPAQFTRERPDAPRESGRDVVFTFDGHLHSVYSTLAVRLSHSRLFRREEMWHNSASYLALAGGSCGISLREITEGRGELALFYDQAAGSIVRQQFEAYVVEHLQSRAVPSTVEVCRPRVCIGCRYTIPEEVVRARLGRCDTTMRCPMCDERDVTLTDEDQPHVEDVQPAVAEMNSHANAQRDRDVAATTLKGKRETGDYDVFLCHNAVDKSRVVEIARQLEAHGVLPWLDVRVIRPGARWQPEMADGIRSSRAAAVLLGPAGRGPWHETEMQLIQDRAVRDGIPVIPVILDGVDGTPVLPDFLTLWHTVDMRVADPDPIAQLVWGITGRQP